MGANISENSAVIETFGRVDMADMRESNQASSRSAWCLSKSLSLKNSAQITDQRAPSAGFFMAVCKYGRDNQPNDTNGSAARTSVGGNGGRILEPAREQVSMLGHAFNPEIETCVSLKLPKRRMAPKGCYAER